MTSPAGQKQEETLEGRIAIGNLLCGSWELSQKILENLSFFEVSKLRLVCRLWSDVGKMILAKRRHLHYLTIHPHNIPTTLGKITIGEMSPASLLDGFFSQIVSKPCYCLVFCSGDVLLRKDTYSYEDANGEKVPITISEYLHKTLPLPCELGVVLATGIVGTVETSYQGYWLESAETMNQEIFNYLARGATAVLENSKNNKIDDNSSSTENYNSDNDNPTLDENISQPSKRPRKEMTNNSNGATSSNSNISSGDTVGNSIKSVEMDTKLVRAKARNRERERERGMHSSQTLPLSPMPLPLPNPLKSNVGYSIEVEQNTDGLSLLVIPHHPGVKLNFFNVCPEKYYADFRRTDPFISESEFNHLVSLSPDDPLEALLLFDTCADDEFTISFVKAALKRTQNKLALGGGVAEICHIGRNGKFPLSSSAVSGVAVSGSNIMAASVVIPERVNNLKNLARYMMMLKSCGLPERQSVAFMFTCWGRGCDLWRSIRNTSCANVESTAFRKLFPNTPLFGFFGRGEIGISHLPKYSDDQVPSTIKKRTKAFHQFSTVIVLLSFL